MACSVLAPLACASPSLTLTRWVVPAERLLVETDSPYLSPTPWRGRRNEPAHVRHTATKLAEVRGVTLTDLSAQLGENVQRLFGVAIEATV